MTQDEIAAQKRKMFMVFGVGVASLLASYAIGYVGPRTSVSTLTEVMLTAIFLGCILVGGTIAYRLNKETGSK
jgi:hypothetical protein